jgi:hypothetical protein
MVDLDSYRLFLLDNGRWVESEDPTLRQRVRMNSLEISPDKAERIIAAQASAPTCSPCPTSAVD